MVKSPLDAFGRVSAGSSGELDQSFEHFRTGRLLLARTEFNAKGDGCRKPIARDNVWRLFVGRKGVRQLTCFTMLMALLFSVGCAVFAVRPPTPAVYMDVN